MANNNKFCISVLAVALMLQSFFVIMFIQRHNDTIDTTSRKQLMGSAIDSAAAAGLRKKTEPLFKVEDHGYPIPVHSELGDFAPDVDDVTWVTQMSPDRFEIFFQLLQRWNGPVCAVIYSDSLTDDLEYLRPFQKKYKVDFHYTPSQQNYYPVNLLRNVAMDHSRTDFILFADVDFIPNVDAYELIRARIPLWKKEDLKVVRVIPAFQMNHTCGKLDLPKTKQELIDMGGCIHQVHNDPNRAAAHIASNYPVWISTEMEEYPINYHAPYEPYYVAHKSIPRYDHRFIVYGNDKMIQAYECSVSGWKFVGIPTSFVVHVDHGVSPWTGFPCPKDILNAVSDAFWERMKRIERNEPKSTLSADPKSSLRVVKSRRGLSCTEACQAKDLQCKVELFPLINNCDILEKNYHCFRGCAHNHGPDLPNFDVPVERCLIERTNEFSCDGKHRDTRRLCPCA